MHSTNHAQPDRRRGIAACVIGVAFALASGAVQAQHGFADKPLGDPKDPRIEILASVGANGAGEVVVPGDDAFDPCGNYVFDPATNSMAIDTRPKTLPQALTGSKSAWIALRFPFAIDKPKIAKTIYQDKPELAPLSYLTPNVQVVDENGAAIPLIATIGGKDVKGVDLSADPNFPVVLGDSGENLLASKRTLLLVAKTLFGSLETQANFAGSLANPTVSAVREVRIRVEEVGGISIHGFWVLKIGDSSGVAIPGPGDSLVATSIEATKPEKPEHFVDFGLVVKANSSFVIAFSEPVDPWSVGVTKSLAKQYDIPFEKNVAVTLHPCHWTSAFLSGAPLFPNVQINVHPNGKPAFPAPFNVRPVNPNNLAEYYLDPLVSLPKGTLDIWVFPISLNPNPYESLIISSAVTSLHGARFDDTSINAARKFAVDG